MQIKCELIFLDKEIEENKSNTLKILLKDKKFKIINKFSDYYRILRDYYKNY